MELLLIGMSRFARRRVLPAVSSMSEIDTINIASSHATPESVGHLPKIGQIYADWREALEVTRPGLIYISLVNSEHAAAVHHALERGHHVVVDKPGLLDLSTTEEMVELARASSLVVAEATCYAFHPLFPFMRSLDPDTTKIVAVFTPPVPAGDFRHDRRKGGGALLDTGPYMASLGRVLWDEEPEQVGVVVGDRTADGLEISYSALAGYPGGKTIVGHFGFTTTYQNTLRMMSKNAVMEVERPFSVLPDMVTGIKIQSNGRTHERNVPPADSMKIFLYRVIEAVNKGSREFDEFLLSDARTLDRLRQEASKA
ncbi:Gfo/Idh/MocA family protein [Streptomyces sp. NPDC057963]|uniref:Gfo/Idh/MocA family protein n=1 Tax=Streptomyces sp. NPDC057963 TaxID=3346290 RepID=UPI0036EFF201